MSAATVALSVLLLTLTACVPAPDVVVPVEPSLGQPVFASDEEALAAAVEVFANYAEAVALVSQRGGSDPELIKPFVTTELFEREVDGFRDFEELDIRLIGSALYTPLKLQQHWIDDSGKARVIAYFCADTRDYQVVKGNSVPYKPESVPDAYLIEVEFVSDSTGSTELLVKEVGEWQRPDGCLA